MAVVNCGEPGPRRRKKIAISPPGLTLAHSTGRIVLRHRSHGRIVVAKWPKKRGPPKSPTTQLQVALWDFVLLIVKYVDGLIVMLAHEESRGTAFYARDILIMAAYGNYLSWPGWGPFPDGPPHQD